MAARPSRRLTAHRGSTVALAAAVTATIALVSLATGRMAHAGDNDFRLNATSADNAGLLFQATPDGRFEPLDNEWRSLVTQLGYVFSPKLMSPAETLGHAGFSVGAIWSGTFVSGKKSFWQITDRGQRTGRGASLLQTLQLDVRKGLPFSFEIGANVMWLVDSQLLAPGLELRWALQEGYRYIPDLAVRGSVNQMVGNRDMRLTTAGVDIVISKSFGVLGVLNLAPYASWSFLFIAANSRVIDPTPTTENDPDKNFIFRSVRPGASLNHKLTFGLRTLYAMLNFSVQGELQAFSEGRTFGPVGAITTKLGLDF